MFILIEGTLSCDCLLRGFPELVKMAWKNPVGTLAVCSFLHKNNVSSPMTKVVWFHTGHLHLRLVCFL